MTTRRKLGAIVLGLLVRIDEVLMDWFWDRGYGSWDEDDYGTIDQPCLYDWPLTEAEVREEAKK